MKMHVKRLTEEQHTPAHEQNDILASPLPTASTVKNITGMLATKEADYVHGRTLISIMRK